MAAAAVIRAPSSGQPDVKTRTRELIEAGDKLFSARRTLDSLWQEIADNFYPERADFTSSRTLGTDFAANLMTGYPVLCRRNLANSFASMLRPRGKPWFSLVTDDERINEDQLCRRYLEHVQKIMFAEMYARKSQFVRATKEGDNDFAAFGQAVILPELNRNKDGMLYRCFHLRDAAWCENSELEIDTVHRKWKLAARSLAQLFPNTVSSTVKDLAEKEPHKEVSCRHIVLPYEAYDLSKAKNPRRFPFVSIYVDCENDTILEEVPRARLKYAIPRWQTVSGSQYAHCPATVVALADARLIQQMSLALLEAGEKSVTPPMVATMEAIRSDINVYAGGVTAVDAEYDEKLGEVLRPLTQDIKGFTYGLDMVKDVREMIKEAFFLNSIQLPAPDVRDMTAYETQRRIEEYIRAALPLFEPMEIEYNGALCEETYEELKTANAFGPPEDMPQMLSKKEFQFSFESPLQGAQKRAKTEAYTQTAQLLATSVNLDPSLASEVDLRKAFRDAIDGVATSAEWLRSDEEAGAINEQKNREAQMQQLLTQVGEGAAAAKNIGAAANSMAQAGLV